MLRIDDERTPSENSTDNENRKLSKQELLALDTRELEAKNPSNLEDDEEQADDFASLKAQAWGRMVPGQINEHLAGLRSKAEQLQNPSKEPTPKPSRVLHYHCDHLGTPRELTNEQGQLVWSADYWAWGKVKDLKGRSGGAGTDIESPDAPRNQFWHTRTQPGRANHVPEWVADNTGNVQKWRQLKDAEQPDEATAEAVNDPSVWGEPTDQSIRFQGQWHDPETGLHYNRFRYYDPDVGRFIHQDPIKLAGGDNLYGYAPNPMVWLDPFGLKGFFAPCKFKAPSGKEHTVYQQDINWDLPVNTRNGVKTNLEIASEGGSPFVVKNGKYSQLNLHHSKQNTNGSLFELSADTHQAYYGSNALHPHLPNAHPINPVDRDSFNVDRGEYWRQRAAQEKSRRLGKKCSCTC